MTHETPPGIWPRLSREGHRRLVSLARRRLVGWELDAEDVVQLAYIKWSSLDPALDGTARIEQVVKSTADSWRRSDQRRIDREVRYQRLKNSRPEDTLTVVELSLAVEELEHLAFRAGLGVSERDRVVLRLLLEGSPMSEISRETGFSLSQVRTSKSLWQTVWQRSEQFAALGPYGRPHH